MSQLMFSRIRPIRTNIFKIFKRNSCTELKMVNIADKKIVVIDGIPYRPVQYGNGIMALEHMEDE